MDLCLTAVQKGGKSPAWDARDDVFVDDRKSLVSHHGLESTSNSSASGGMLNTNMNREWMRMFGDLEKPDRKSDAIPELASSPTTDTLLLGFVFSFLIVFTITLTIILTII
jgi:hypothetical protein